VERLYAVTLLGYPLPLLVLLFLWYSFWGWAMETAYCSVKERRFVFRGFLKGPICPIYGSGVLMMVFCLTPFAHSFPLFYLVATVTMSAWEYFVGWLLETTTHIKYWDYSQQPFNLKGRICLGTSLYWGAAAWAAIYWLHPATLRLAGHLSPLWQCWLASLLSAVTLADGVITIRHLALTSGFLRKAEEKRAELERLRGQLRQAGLQKLQTARLQASLARMELEHSQFLQEAARHSARFRARYPRLSSLAFAPSLKVVREQAVRLLKERAERFARQNKGRKKGSE
jgi:uncharacterized membrane protein